ncbi:MAG TPA: type III secretion system export apparatus subunit SctU [Candidatus Avidesulfovibrio excrementigallinarum]|nr:type III secretion system export apparatus subunit SctU [Candidatus Avidesulfovibrio excrementigallinarum]
MSDEKTEQATPKRLRDIREKGQVAKSQDVPSALTVMAVAVYFLAMASSMLNTLLTMGEIPMRIMNLPFEEALPMAVTATFHCALLVAGPLIGMVMVVALCANLLQVGVLVSLQAAMPKLDNIHPDKWFKKIFSLKNLVEFIKNVIKVSVLSLTVYIIFTDYLPRLFRIPMGDIGDMWVLLGAATGDLVLTAAAVFCVIAALDWFFQKWQFGKQNMMSKDEVKREYKESEGDPLIKSKRKQLHQELIAQNQLSNVRKAKVLVTNPTHFAVALDYEKERTPLPVILAKGQGVLAQRMIEVAKEEGIPIMRNVPLARSLFEQGTEQSYIPQELIGPVAEVLRWVQSLNR